MKTQLEGSGPNHYKIVFFSTVIVTKVINHVYANNNNNNDNETIRWPLAIYFDQSSISPARKHVLTNANTLAQFWH